MKIDNEHLRIALLGAPTSGKTQVAEEFAKAIGEGFRVVDNPADRVSNMGYELGATADFRTALSLATFQLEDEKRGHDECNTITLGTPLQRLAHTGAAVHVLGERVERFPTIDNRRSLLIENNIGHLLAFLLAEEFQYHFVFHLPLPDTSGLIVPGEDVSDDRSYNSRVDTGFRQLIDAFFIPAKVLTGDDRAAQMVAHVKESMAKVAAEEAEKPVEV